MSLTVFIDENGDSVGDCNGCFSVRAKASSKCSACLQDACNARGLNITTISLLGTVPIVPVDITLPHKVGYILGPILAVFFIAFFFGMMSYLAWEKNRNIKSAQDVEGQKTVGKPGKAGRAGMLAGLASRFRGGRSGKKAAPAQPTAARGAANGTANGAAPAAAGHTAMQPQQMTPNGKGSAALTGPEAAAAAELGVSPARDPRNLSPLSLFKSGGRRSGRTETPRPQDDFMTSNPMYGSSTPATPGSAASGKRSPVMDFFGRTRSELASMVSRGSGQGASGQGRTEAGTPAETPRGAGTPR